MSHRLAGRTPITLDNQSGENALVKLVGPTAQTVEVPNGQSKTVNVADGDYHILTRYGVDPAKYRYSKGDSFTVTETATQRSAITITLHKVIGGNYPDKPISQDEFDQVKLGKSELISLGKAIPSKNLLQLEQIVVNHTESAEAQISERIIQEKINAYKETHKAIRIGSDQSKSVTIPRGRKAVSDPISFHSYTALVLAVEDARAPDGISITLADLRNSSLGIFHYTYYIIASHNAPLGTHEVTAVVIAKEGLSKGKKDPL